MYANEKSLDTEHPIRKFPDTVFKDEPRGCYVGDASELLQLSLVEAHR